MCGLPSAERAVCAHVPFALALSASAQRHITTANGSTRRRWRQAHRVLFRSPPTHQGSGPQAAARSRLGSRAKPRPQLPHPAARAPPSAKARARDGRSAPAGEAEPGKVCVRRPARGTGFNRFVLGLPAIKSPSSERADVARRRSSLRCSFRQKRRNGRAA